MINLISLANQFQLLAHEWLQIPYGDHPHAQGIQRLDQASAETLVANFNSFRSRLGRMFGGLPIYVGHPDVPSMANEFLDKKAYGWIMDAEAREDGLYLKPKWSPAGEEMIANGHYKWFSPYWGCQEVGTEKGKPVFRPIRLASIGLTNQPNISGLMPMSNESASETNPPGSAPEAMPGNQEESEMLEKIRKLLNLANDAGEDQTLAGITALVNERDAAKAEIATANTAKATAETALANATTAATSKTAEADTLKTQLANAQAQIAAERGARVAVEIANAISAGKITAAQKDAVTAELVALDPDKLATRLQEIANAKPVLPVESTVGALGGRNSQVVDKVGQIQMLVNEKRKTVPDYDTAFAAVKTEHPELFAAKGGAKQ